MNIAKFSSLRFTLIAVTLLLLSIASEAQPTIYTGEIPEYMMVRNPAADTIKFPRLTRASNQRSDTIDILHYVISLDVTDFTTDTLRGNCRILFKSKMDGISNLLLDLQKFKIDSVKQNDTLLSYLYTGQVLLNVDLLHPLQKDDSAAVTVYYHGRPVTDPVFGGFYFQNGIAYNIGVGASNYPHMFGRAWYPCFDNFIERATYEYFITTPSGKMATSNGALIDSVTNIDSTVTWHWLMEDEIPTFISCIAVGAYTPLYMTFNGLNGPVPVMLSALAADTTRMKNSFAHLADAFAIFENKYGAYRWNKVGYSIVPQNPVAMEHATNITYPGTTLTGDNMYENLMAHELAHHWFGNQVTPRTAEDYWLKEGWASFSERVFYEGLYGKQRYTTEIAANHEQVLRCTHIFDGGYIPLYPIPQTVTYGKTTYANGSDAAHSLRGYFDDDDKFFGCLKSYLTDNANTDQSSYTFRDYLTNCSGIDLTDFFEDNVFAPGFAQFGIDTFTTEQNGSSYDVTVDIRQKLNHAPHYHNNVPMDITFRNNQWETVTEKVMISGPCTIYRTSLPFNPTFACLDLYEKISDATTDNYATIRSKGTFNFPYGKMKVKVNNITDSVFLRIEHNFVAPDTFKHRIKNLHISQQRYWKVDGIIPDGFEASADIDFNGQIPFIPTTGGSYYLDNYLITNSEDSVVVLYRPSFSSDWKIDTNVVVAGGVKTDKKGTFTINHLKKGEYTLGIYQYNKVDSVFMISPDTCHLYASAPNIIPNENDITLYPNPAKTNFTVDGWLKSDCKLEIFNLNGQCVYQTNLYKGYQRRNINTDQLGNNLYMVKISDNRNVSIVKKLLVID